MLKEYYYREANGYKEKLKSSTFEEALEETKTLLRDGSIDDECLKTFLAEAFIDITINDRIADIHTINLLIDPVEPSCEDGKEHFFQRKGGLPENPGVQGYYGGFILTEICENCGLTRIKNAWDISLYSYPVKTIEYIYPAFFASENGGD